MLLTREAFLAKLASTGMPVGTIQFIVPDQVNGALFGSIGDDFVMRAWDAYVALLQSDAGAKLTMQREIGGGKSITVPNYVAPGAVCRHQAFAFYGFLLLCLMKKAAAEPQQNDGYMIGPFYYTAAPRAEDLYRDGRHGRIIYVNDAGDVKEFEEGDGAPEQLTPAEHASTTFSVFT